MLRLHRSASTTYPRSHWPGIMQGDQSRPRHSIAVPQAEVTCLHSSSRALEQTLDRGGCRQSRDALRMHGVRPSSRSRATAFLLSTGPTWTRVASSCRLSTAGGECLCARGPLPDFNVDQFVSGPVARPTDSKTQSRYQHAASVTGTSGFCRLFICIEAARGGLFSAAAAASESRLNLAANVTPVRTEPA
jgi:hypothetical protein